MVHLQAQVVKKAKFNKPSVNEYVKDINKSREFKQFSNMMAINFPDGIKVNSKNLQMIMAKVANNTIKELVQSLSNQGKVATAKIDTLVASIEISASKMKFEDDFSEKIWDNGLKESLASYLDVNVSKLEKVITYCAVQPNGHASFDFSDTSLLKNLDEVDGKANEQLDMGLTEDWEEAVEFVLDEYPIDFYLDMKDNTIEYITMGE